MTTLTFSTCEKNKKKASKRQTTKKNNNKETKTKNPSVKLLKLLPILLNKQTTSPNPKPQQRAEFGIISGGGDVCRSQGWRWEEPVGHVLSRNHGDSRGRCSVKLCADWGSMMVGTGRLATPRRARRRAKHTAVLRDSACSAIPRLGT